MLQYTRTAVGAWAVVGGRWVAEVLDLDATRDHTLQEEERYKYLSPSLPTSKGAVLLMESRESFQHSKQLFHRFTLQLLQKLLPFPRPRNSFGLAGCNQRGQISPKFPWSLDQDSWRPESGDWGTGRPRDGKQKPHAASTRCSTSFNLSWFAAANRAK